MKVISIIEKIALISAALVITTTCALSDHCSASFDAKNAAARTGDYDHYKRSGNTAELCAALPRLISHYRRMYIEHIENTDCTHGNPVPEAKAKYKNFIRQMEGELRRCAPSKAPPGSSAAGCYSVLPYSASWLSPNATAVEIVNKTCADPVSVRVCLERVRMKPACGTYDVSRKKPGVHYTVSPATGAFTHSLSK